MNRGLNAHGLLLRVVIGLVVALAVGLAGATIDWCQAPGGACPQGAEVVDRISASWGRLLLWNTSSSIVPK